MVHKEDQPQMSDSETNNESLCSTTKTENLKTSTTPRQSIDKEGNSTTCRVCQCVESDSRGDAALGFLGIYPPSLEVLKVNEDQNSNGKVVSKGEENDVEHAENCGREPGVIEFISPEGEVFVCGTDLEVGPHIHQDALICLGCCCKNDLSLAHYACALKWFINHGSTVCEICGSVAKNVRPSDFKKIVASLRDYEALKERTANGEPTLSYAQTNVDVDPDAVAGIRRQRLSEISLWFNPHNNNNHNNDSNYNSSSTRISQGVVDQPSGIPIEDALRTESPATKWAVEGTGILVATGLLTVTLAWLIAPRVGKL
ncbi:zinc finger protein [Macleaya cordata]|uniref:Zinc finger protein n=1 Tax=Macleaya cordata TaxID=56857 RepID=A0A200QA90_MACCD|nr:zinc finger protein [Macleaya cordata]